MDDSKVFSVIKRNITHELIAKTQFDFLITRSGIKEALFALLASQNGHKCLILCNEDFEENLHPIIDCSQSSNSLLKDFRNKFPHLILPDEYLFIKKNVSKWKKFLPGSIRDKDISKYESLLSTKDNDAIYIENEFKISTHRLLLSILKSSVAEGAIVMNHSEVKTLVNNQVLVTDVTKDDFQSYEINIKKQLTFNQDRVPQSKKELRIFINKKGLFLKRSLKFEVDGALVRLIRYQDYFMLTAISQNDNKHFTRNILLQLNSLLNWDDSFSENDIILSEEVGVNKDSDLKSQLDQLRNTVIKELKLSGSQFTDAINSLPIPDSKFENRTEIQQLIEFGDYRFDEAKQTGVHPLPFKNMFYRYGTNIEELTEKAYELRSEFGPGNELWKFVQLWYLYQNEMICTYADYVSRIKANRPLLDSDLLTTSEKYNNWKQIIIEKYAK